MRKIILSSLIVLILGVEQTCGQRICTSTFNPQQIQQTDNQRYQRFLQLEQHILNYRNSLNNGNLEGRLVNPNGTIIIPVVVHVIHNASEAIGVGRNISVAQIQSQIDVLNEDFRRLNADRINTPNAFQGFAADPNIEFRLACIDPNGNPTTGITRTASSITSFTDNDNIKFNSTGGHDAWPTSQYLNIWVGNLGGGLLGYAQFPFDYAIKPNTDGVVIRTTAFGRIGNVVAPFNTGRSTTHEIGHWLNLFHVWGDDGGACTGTDQCADTPNQEDENFGCPIFPSPSCNNNGDMSMNYMDYSDDACMNIYTVDQRIRMRAIFAQDGPRAAMIENIFGFVGQPTSFSCTGSIRVSPMCLPVAWTITGPATITGGQGTNQISLSATGTGNVHLTATSGNYIAETDIAVTIVKTPTMLTFNGFTYSEQNAGTICLGGYADYEVSVVDADPNTSYWWTVSSAADFRFGQGTNEVRMTVGDYPGSYLDVSVQPENSCGLGSAFNLTLQICDDGLRVMENAFTVSPNPAIDMISIQKVANASNQKTKEVIEKAVINEVRVFDNAGNLKKQVKFGKGTSSSQLNLAGLKEGLYYVEIVNGKLKERHQLLIKK